MTSKNTKEITNRMRRYYTTEIDKSVRRWVRHLVRELAKGEPVPPSRIAELMGISEDEAVKLLKGATLQDDQGRVTAFGLSLQPTEFQYEMDGRTFGLWCAVDALVFPTLIGKPARIKAQCAVTGEPIELELTPDSVKSLTPESAVVSIMNPKLDQQAEQIVKHLQQLFCSGQLFFKSAEVAKKWQEKHPETIIMPAADAFEMYRQLCKEVWEV